MTTPEPSVAPAARVPSNVSGMSSCVGPDEDARRAAEQDRPGCARPPGTPPASASSSPQRGPERDLVDAGAGDVARQAEQLRAGRARGADARVRVAALGRMSGTLTSVSTLLTTVGLPNSPTSTGKGGLLRGSPRLPSIELKSAVSSPQMYAPAPRRISMSKAKPEPRMSGPSRPAARASAMARGHARLGERVLAADVEVALLGAGREAGDGHGLEDGERIVLHAARDP